MSDDLIKNCMACKNKFSLVNRKVRATQLHNIARSQIMQFFVVLLYMIGKTFLILTTYLIHSPPPGGIHREPSGRIVIRENGEGHSCDR